MGRKRRVRKRNGVLRETERKLGGGDRHREGVGGRDRWRDRERQTEKVEEREMERTTGRMRDSDSERRGREMRWERRRYRELGR